MCPLASVGVCLHHWLSYGKFIEDGPRLGLPFVARDVWCKGAHSEGPSLLALDRCGSEALFLGLPR